MSEKSRKKVIIMGAGLAGLAAGFELSKKGFSVEVYEKWDEEGGLARTLRHGKFLFDTGPHRWYTKNDKVNKWMLKLLGKDVITVPRLTRIYFDKKFFYYPIRIGNALKGIGVLNAARAVADYFSSRLRVRLFKPVLLTMEDGYISQFGKTLYEIFFKRYSEKLWGVDCNKISIDWVGQRTRGLNITTLIKDTLIKSKNVVSLVDEFSYPKYGIGQLAEKMAEGIRKNKGKVMLSSEVVKVSKKGDRITSIDIKNGSGRKTVTGDYFISSIPLSDLVFRLSPKVPEPVRKTAGKLTYRDELQVVLFVRKERVTNDTWIYIHPKHIPYMRLMEMSNWSGELSPSGKTSLVFEIACNEGDRMWRKKDSELVEMVKKSYVKEFGLVKPVEIEGGLVHRVPKEYPVYHIGYREDTEMIKKYLSGISNLQIIGRNGVFRYNNMDHSVEMGLFAAGNIIAGKKLYDVESVNIEREYLEEKKLENIEDETLEKEEKN